MLKVLDIEVNDVKVEIGAMKLMLTFIYSGFKAVELTGDSVFPVLYIGIFLWVKNLETMLDIYA